MKTNQCELCKETVTSNNEKTCDECGKRTCEECGRTRTRRAQIGRSLNATVGTWQCVECEFGNTA